MLRVEREISRTVSFKTSQGTIVRGTLHKLSRRNIVFEVYNPFLLIRTSEVLSDLQVRQGRSTLFQGDAVVTGVVSTSILLVVSATLSGTWSDLNDVLGPNRGLRTDAEDFINEWVRANRLNPAYRLRVDDLRSFLNDLRYWLDQIDLGRDAEADPVSAPIKLDRDEFKELTGPVMPRISELFMGLEEASRALDPVDVDIHKQLAQRDLLPLMMPSPFFNRVFTKPLGYAGDYEMVNMMYRNQCDGLTTYAQVVDDWLLQGGPPQAHRNRIQILQQVLSEISSGTPPRNRPIRILNIGCGPAQELQLFLSRHDLAHRFQIDLLDFNEETLEFARRNLGPIAGRLGEKAGVSYTLKSVQDMLRQAIERSDAPEPYDFIYCAGLFDYLSDRVCAKLVRLFYHWCEPGGRVLVTNVHSSNPVKGLMEHVMEWHLVLRDEADMQRMTPGAAPAKVYVDGTGINVFLDIFKPS